MPFGEGQEKYTYDVDVDFPEGKVNPTLLESEIEASEIETVLDVIIVNENLEENPPTHLCDIWFETELAEGEEAILDAIVAAHTGDDTLQNPKNIFLPVQNPNGNLGEFPTLVLGTSDEARMIFYIPKFFKEIQGICLICSPEEAAALADRDIDLFYNWGYPKLASNYNANT